jgi:hypothetical protein
LSYSSSFGHNNFKETLMAKFHWLIPASLLAALSLAGCASMGGGDARWQTLIDGSKGLDNWSSIAGANWRPEDDAIVADRKPGAENAFLLSRNSYRDFQIRTEFWVSDDANTGIYMRCSDARPITDRTCYEANVFDRRPDPTYGTGAIVHLSKVDPMPKAGGKWNTYDITVKGSRITVMLNGVKTAEAEDSKLASGPVALQYAGGVVKFRKFQIRPL